MDPFVLIYFPLAVLCAVVGVVVRWVGDLFR